MAADPQEFNEIHMTFNDPQMQALWDSKQEVLRRAAAQAARYEVTINEQRRAIDRLSKHVEWHHGAEGVGAPGIPCPFQESEAIKREEETSWRKG
jgi:hypothetical protein